MYCMNVENDRQWSHRHAPTPYLFLNNFFDHSFHLWQVIRVNGVHIGSSNVLVCVRVLRGQL